MKSHISLFSYLLLGCAFFVIAVTCNAAAFYHSILTYIQYGTEGITYLYTSDEAYTVVAVNLVMLTLRFNILPWLYDKE